MYIGYCKNVKYNVNIFVVYCKNAKSDVEMYISQECKI